MAEKHRETITGYGVLLQKADGTSSLALGSTGGKAFFWWRRNAVAFRNELAQHINQRGRVVKVRATFEEV